MKNKTPKNQKTANGIKSDVISSISSVHERGVDLGNPLRNLVGNPHYERIPTKEEVLEELLNGMAKFKGTCWSPVSPYGGYSLMLNQCPQACGDVWRINIQDKDVAAWLVNEINVRRRG